MHDAHISEVVQSFENSFDIRLRFSFVHAFPLPELRLEVPLVAEFGDYVAVSVASEYFLAFEDVGVVQAFENIDF